MFLSTGLHKAYSVRISPYTSLKLVESLEQGTLYQEILSQQEI